MMNCTSHLPNQVEYSSEEWHESLTLPGVRFSTYRLSLGNRLALMERLRDLLRQYEFLRAGNALEQTEASLADFLVRRLYLEWGLASIQGLFIDGSPASIKAMVNCGPELLADEIVSVIRAKLELSDEERKNS